MTEVVSAGAGLYVMDRKVSLCLAYLAYRPSLKRALKVGDSVQVRLGPVFLLLFPVSHFSRGSTGLEATDKVGG